MREAKVTLSGGAASFDGLFLVTPFAQTTDRLLPDHSERALRTVGLAAVSPALLRGVERDMWLQGNAPAANVPVMRLACRLSGFMVSPDSTAKGRLRLDAGARIALETTFRRKANDPLWDIMRPWLWLRHGTLPTVQTLPIAATGAERPLPSGNRALAPFVVREMPTAGGFATKRHGRQARRPWR